MISKQVKDSRRWSRPSLAGQRNVSFKPALEFLESRSLLNASSFVEGLYTNILQRPPTQAEENAWVSQMQNGLSAQAVGAAIVQSSEHQALIVKDDFSNFLGRSADPQGLNYWAQQLASGASQDSVAAGMISSQEFLMKHGSTVDDIIQGIYQTVLHRNADPAGLAYWRQQFLVRTDSQVTTHEVALRILGSTEAHQQEVNTYYAQTLHRSPDDAGGAYWVNFLDNGGSQTQVLVGLVTSPEYLNDYGAFTLT